MIKSEMGIVKMSGGAALIKADFCALVSAMVDVLSRNSTRDKAIKELKEAFDIGIIEEAEMEKKATEKLLKLFEQHDGDKLIAVLDSIIKSMEVN